jgi:hypothetical protein
MNDLIYYLTRTAPAIHTNLRRPSLKSFWITTTRILTFPTPRKEWRPLKKLLNRRAGRVSGRDGNSSKGHVKQSNRKNRTQAKRRKVR